MMGRLDLAVEKGCDGVEPDNLDAYVNDNGLSLSRGEQIDYNSWLAAEGHDRGLAVGLKNSLEYGELTPFTQAGKPVFHAEYDRAMIDDSFRVSCDE